MFFWILFPLCLCSEALLTIKEKTKKLHDLTKYATFYEFYGLKENASKQDIKRVFRTLRRATAPPGLTQAQFDDLVMSAFTIMHDYADGYKEALGSSNFAYFEENLKYGFKSHFYILVLALVLGLIFVDAVVYAIRYVKYTEEYEIEKKELRKSKKSSKSTVTEESAENVPRKPKLKERVPPSMVIVTILRGIKGIFIRK